MTILFLLILWCPLAIGAFNYWDYKVTKDGGKPSYLIYFLVRAGAAILHGSLMLIVLEDDHTNYGDLSAWQLLALWAPYLSFQVTTFWIQYEITRNIWTNQAWLYYDQYEKDSGIIDRFFAWTGPTFHAMAKLFALAVAVLCVILIYSRH